jgi:histidyl-tRNA synthetase
VNHNGEPSREYDFYQVIDKLEREEPAVSEQKLASLGFSLADVRAFIQEGKPTNELQTIFDNLTARGLTDFVKVDYGVIRGLAYYTGVVFEAFDREGENRAIAGGGRYDNLIKLISGGKTNLPALGFGMGDVVLLDLLAQKRLVPIFGARLDVFCLIEDETLRPESLKLIQDLRTKGLAVDYSFTPAKSDRQFKRAQELNAAHLVKVERNPAGSFVARIKNLSDRAEKVVSTEDAAKALIE